MTEQSIQKNQNYQITITDLGTKGEGIGKLQGLTIFVKDALPQDQIEIRIIMLKKNFAVGKLIKIITPSPLRTNPACKALSRCGGCQIQNMDYAAQLALKSKKVTDSLTRIGKILNPPILPIIGMETAYHYRNKAQFAIGPYKESYLIGLYAINTHNIINLHNCMIQHPNANEIITQFRTYLDQVKPSIYNERTHTGLIRHIMIRTSFHDNSSMLCVIINGYQLPETQTLINLLQKIPGFTSLHLNINTQKGDTILSDQSQHVWGEPYLIENILDLKFTISPNSFFQVNPKQTAILINTVMEYADLTGQETVWDAYCGIGTFALFLAQKAQKVIGVEIIAKAIEDAKQNALLNNLTNLEFIQGTCEDILPKLTTKPDLIVVDPPRKGLDEKLLNTILKILPHKLIYVSCNPDTLARDLNIFTTNGYKLQKVQPVDMFPHTMHVECVTLLTLQ